MPLRPWGEDSAVMTPPLLEQRSEGKGSVGMNLYGQVLAWSEDGRWVKARASGLYPQGFCSCFADAAPLPMGIMRAKRVRVCGIYIWHR